MPQAAGMIIAGRFYWLLSKDETIRLRRQQAWSRTSFLAA
jgi:hypothetical protein